MPAPYSTLHAPRSTGVLYIVGTPIGNMEDITLRALRVLREADIIAAEDTRRTAQLLSRHGISLSQSVGPDRRGGRLISYHEFNEAKRTPELLKTLQEGRTVALVSDAGMPAISDPGHRLIQAVLASGIALEAIPGPSAITAALVTSGLANGHFLFYGFLPHKSTQRRKTLALLAPLPYTLVFFESPYRLVKSLHDMLEILGTRHVVIARELTKKFEEIIRGNLAAVLKKLENRSIKGEITIVIEGRRQ